jgi:uncharacterized membrane protein (GlpM family)
MREVMVVLVKAIAGGAFVLLFALLGQVLHPKWFSGFFSAAPSVAVAGLIITVVDKGDHEASLNAIGMMFGAVAFVVFALCVRGLLVRHSALVASALACVAWLVAAIGGYLLVLR